MSTTESTSAPSPRTSAVKRRGPYLVTKIERGLTEERNTRSGTTRYRLRYTRSDGTKTEVSLKATTRREAKAEAAKVRADIARGVRIEPSKLTCRALWEHMKVELDAQVAAGDRKARSVENTEAALRKWCWPSISNVKIEEVRRSHVQRILAKAQEAGLSSWSVKGVNNALSALLQYACDNDMLAKNVARLPRKDRPKVSDAKATYVPSTEEVEALIENVTPQYRAIVLTLATCGLRDGEARGLRWSSINWETGQIAVTHQLGRQGIGLESLKTQSSVRTVPMTARLRAALREHQIASRNTEPEDLLFVTESGRGLSYIAVRRALQAAIKKANIEHGEERLGQHALRHYVASKLIAGGMNLVQVSRVLGHSKVSTTLDVYAHLLQDNDGAALLASVEAALSAGGAS